MNTFTKSLNFCGSFLALVLVLALNTNAALAADKPSRPSIQLLHKPVTDKTLPSPGQNLVLSLELSGTRSIALPVRLVAVRDGRVLPVPLQSSYRNGADRPVYEFSLASPLAELTYQFIVVGAGANNNSSSALATERFTIRRPCVPSLDFSKAGNANQSELEKLALSARVLEQEIDAYATALSSAELLQKEVAE